MGYLKLQTDMPEKFNFHLPVKVVFGNGRIKELKDFIPETISRILLVSEKNLSENTPVVRNVTDQLNGFDVKQFIDVEENPSFETVKRGGKLAREHKSQLIIGLGGGSPMDAAKGVAMCAVNQEPLSELIKIGRLPVDPLPVICIPTTSGTGSEVTPYAVFTDRNNLNKCGYANEKIFPLVALVDPELTFTMPQPVIANTGLDVLTHSIEAYLSMDATPMSDLVAVESIQLVLKNLGLALEKEKEAMSKMAYASILGGIAITHGGTILLHIMGYPLTVYRNIPHGKANAIMLPSFLNFMREHSFVKEKVHFIDNLFREVGGVERFVNDLGISTNLSNYGIREEDIDEFVEKVIVKGDVKITPARITEKEIRDIYLSAMVG